MAITDIQLTPQEWKNFWAYFKGEPQQVEAIEMLRQFINEADPTLLTQNANWVLKFRESPKEPDVRKLTPGAPYSHQITPSFTYGEICLYQEARRFKHQHQCDTALKLCQFLEKARAHFGSAIIVTSGSRPEPLNQQVGGAPGSEHTFYAAGVGAVDVALERGNQYDLQKWVDANWPESVGYGAPSFVHVGCRGDGQRRRWNY